MNTCNSSSIVCTHWACPQRHDRTESAWLDVKLKRIMLGITKAPPMVLLLSPGQHCCIGSSALDHRANGFVHPPVHFLQYLTDFVIAQFLPAHQDPTIFISSTGTAAASLASMSHEPTQNTYWLSF